MVVSLDELSISNGCAGCTSATPCGGAVARRRLRWARALPLRWRLHQSQSACFCRASLCRPSAEQAVALASLVCKSAEALERFLAFAEQQARDLLAPHVPIIMALSIVLKIRRTLTGAEIDDVIATTVAGLQLAAERKRRADWRNAELTAARFRAECDPLDAAARATF
ncbi:hypothetical protein [Bradyrhizobium canariense]|uniref:hypothetical protein n=1 Tax=Bradyrhizobium canariense TaxID=255045 RepID=UPI0013966CE8|nr:hypothetical protein [Bradyrhizobium canariense]